jgi:hypothetical protein
MFVRGTGVADTMEILTSPPAAQRVLAMFQQV